ncbi:hypothetical protein J6590_042955 [Homalodisca vitripennis]|nr:hypothetical protein J6590_042955 [Homalodisca vitripennis]
MKRNRYIAQSLLALSHSNHKRSTAPANKTTNKKEMVPKREAAEGIGQHFRLEGLGVFSVCNRAFWDTLSYIPLSFYFVHWEDGLQIPSSRKNKMEEANTTNYSKIQESCYTQIEELSLENLRVSKM